MPVDIDKLKTELANAAYTGKTDQQVADLLNSLTTGRTAKVKSLTSAQIYEAIVGTELDGKTAAAQARIDRIFRLREGIDITPDSQARITLLSVFGAGATRTNLVALASRKVSRAEELGLPAIEVKHIRWARI